MLGVADKASDVARVKELDKITPRKVGKRKVVGINREAAALGKSVEEYHALIRDRIKNSSISEPLKSGVLSSIDYNSFFGLGVIVIGIPSQNDISFYKDDVYWREGDSTSKATSSMKIADITKRF